QGNQAFKSGDYPAAIGHYTTAILADANDPTFPLNRAAAYLKLGKFKDAERDCNTVIKSSPKNPKAYYRRGQARRGLERLDDALAGKSISPGWATHSPAPTRPPMTLLQFTRSWENNKEDRQRWETLKTVPPSAIPQLFKTSLEPAFLVSILQMFLSVAGSASEEELMEIREYMIALSRAQRFSTVMLLLNKEEKQLVKKVWDSLGNVKDKGHWSVG
ncbi:TPR-like protein, partial [Coniophora puteana RWD-64-598 SS2]